MTKLTRGQKNELARQQYQERYSNVLPHGYTIKEHRMGPRDCVDSYSYQIHLNGVCTHPGSCYDYHESALKEIEKLLGL